MFLIRNEKNIVYPCKPQFYYMKVGSKGVNIIWACFRDVLRNFTRTIRGLCGIIYNIMRVHRKKFTLNTCVFAHVLLLLDLDLEFYKVYPKKMVKCITFLVYPDKILLL